jgi:aspartate/methionine/tyrosine aminotransferase
MRANRRSAQWGTGMGSQPKLNTIYSGLGTTVFTVMSGLAVEHGAINLGQGFPDEDGPEEIRKIAAERLVKGPNQYPPMTGIAELRQAVAAHNKRFYGLEYDWTSEVIVTSGATEALSDCIMALLNPGDEAIVIEPFYDCYLPQIEQTGATVRAVSVKPPEWTLPIDELRAAFNAKTKAIVLNTPMNPASKVFTRAELQVLADLLDEHDAFAICDEVYEHLTFDGRRHVPLASLPGMRERCLRIGSAGKTFSLTGWKVGYISGPQRLTSVVAKAHQFVTFTTCPALQYGVAHGLGMADGYFAGLAGELQTKRDFLQRTLVGIGLPVLPCEGTYFMTADISRFGFNGSDYDFCRHITENAKVAAVPMSVFYHPASPAVPNSLIRFCFCKKDEVMAEAAERLNTYFG